MNFKDKVVVITGGTSGIGKQTAIEFSRKGAHVVAFTVDKEEVCKQAIKEIGNAHLTALTSRPKLIGGSRAVYQ